MSETETQQTGAPEDFWQWFQNHQAVLVDLGPEREDLMDILGEALDAYDPALTFEISDPDDKGQRELVISAEGDIDHFPSVTALCDAAPELPGWQVIAFRPRLGLEAYGLTFDDIDFDPDEIWFHWRIDDGNFDLIVFYDDYTDEDRDTYIAATYLLLDMALGEYYVTTGIRYLDIQVSPETPILSGLKSLTALPAAFDAYLKSRS